jgi:omega-6 fatty acid desaturase (delta-12 desaturase)
LLITNLGILLIALLAIYRIGLAGYLIIQLFTLYFAGMMGIWLFYVQHQFDEVYWESDEDWNFAKAAMDGSTYYKLPKVLHWFTGNIGYHHIHHLNPRIPNYNLPKCHDLLSGIESPYTVTLVKSFRLALLHLYDEASGRLISYKAMSLNHK